MTSIRKARWGNLISVGLVLLISILAYLPLIGQLGYYRDDWFPIVARTSGISLSAMHAIDRPVMGWWYRLINHFLGDAPILWHLFAFSMRVAGSLVFLWILKLLWPRQKTVTTLMAVLFAVYPGFLQQTNANNYQNHLVALFFSLSSILCSLQSIQAQKRISKVAWLFPSTLLGLTGLAIYETMLGLEVLRLALVWVLISRIQPKRKAFFKSLPYLILSWLGAGAFIFWRLVIFKSSRASVGGEALISGFLTNPVDALVRVFFGTLQDIVDIGVSAWTVPLYKLSLESNFRDLEISLLLVVIACGVAWVALNFLKRMESTEEIHEPRDSRWAQEAFWIGGISLIASAALVNLSGRNMAFEFNYDRFSLQSIASVAILAGGCLNIIRPPAKIVFALGLIGLSIATHYLNAAYFRDFWEIQRSFWWQTTWRAPGFREDTVLIPVLPNGSRFAEGYEVWAPANLIYSGKYGKSPIHAEVLNSSTINWLQNREVINRWWRTGTRINNFQNALVASMPTRESCVHWIDGQQAEITGADDILVRSAAPFSGIDRIDRWAPGRTPPENIFGREPEHGWCYYYQKAELARQQGNWNEVFRLYAGAIEADLKPLRPVEWLPFYEALYTLGRLDEADDLAGLIRAEKTDFDLFCFQFDPDRNRQKLPVNPALVTLCDWR